MRFTLPNLLYAAAHPLRAIRYVRYRDRVGYAEIANFLPKNPVILEAGAFDGTNSLEMAEFWPGATVHAFEPVPAARLKAEQKAERLDGRMHVYAAALGSCEATMPLHVSGSGTDGAAQSSSLLPPTEAQIREFDFVTFGAIVDVPVWTIAGWMERNAISHLDFLWLDMQGYELKALEGADRALKYVRAIHLEVSHIELYQGAPLYSDVKVWMDKAGFKPAIEAIFRVGGNVLFIKK